VLLVRLSIMAAGRIDERHSWPRQSAFAGGIRRQAIHAL